MDLCKLYLDQTPDFLLRAAAAPEMQRLRHVGMNCGCEYTSFPCFRNLAPYSRYDHSLGVAMIIWRFTRDPAQALSGLLHDIATPVFAHVVDFLRGDYLTQESTEDGTAAIISASPALLAVLKELRLTADDVSDYHRYPIADNDAPRLAADRLEYTLGNCVNYKICSFEMVKHFYEDLSVAQNELHLPELSFRTPEIAEQFALSALACSEIYVADEDRYSMQNLAELLQYAIALDILTEADLYTTEPEVIGKMMRHLETATRWQAYCTMERMERADAPLGDDWRKICAKKRLINPLIAGYGRVSDYSHVFSEKMEAFLSRSQDYWIRGVARR